MKTRLGWLTMALTLSLSAADLPPERHRFTVIAHRGAHTHAHENTLTALSNAIEAEVDYAEIDVRRTIDGHHVLMHDSTVDRMTDGHGRVDQLTLGQIQALHVRDLDRPEVAPDRVPTLLQVLALIKGRLNLYLDFKDGDRAEAARAVREAGVARQVLVYDDPRSVAEWRRVAPELPLIVSPPGEIKTSEKLVDFVKRIRVEVLDGDWTGYSRAMVDAARSAGVRVWPDIQDGDERGEYWARVLDLGLTGAQTDRPEEFMTWLKERSKR